MKVNSHHTISTPVSFSLSPDHTEKIAAQLNHLLAEYHLHYQKLRNFHWNVYGNQFFELHNQFEALYNQARMSIDEIAERILTLQKRPVSNMSDYLYMATIQEEKETLRPTDMVEALLLDFDILIERMNEVIQVAEEAGDTGTADMVTAYLRQTQKSHWMFRAFLRESVLTD